MNYKTTTAQRKENATLAPVLVKSFSSLVVFEILHIYRNEEVTEAIPNEIPLDDIRGTGRTFFPTYGQCLEYCKDVNELRKEIR
jgi:hypothetical protein